MNRDKLERMKTAGSILLVVGCLCAFWVMLFYGICAEVERRSDIPRAAKMKWAHERGLNQWETEQRQPELIKAMQEVKNGWLIPQKR